jgi:hypothetical protein
MQIFVSEFLFGTLLVIGIKETFKDIIRLLLFASGAIF